MVDIRKLLRENIRNLHPYASARDEYKGYTGIFLDANENALGSVTDEKFNRYPDPLQQQVKHRISQIKGIDPAQIFLGNGSDEAIDLLIRAFCNPGKDRVMMMPPTYGMYEVCAAVNAVEVISVPLNSTFEIDAPAVLQQLDNSVKLIFICSPNNPSGNCLSKKAIETILGKFNGLVIVDEAYIDFSDEESWLQQLNSYKNLVILQTFSKAWGLANLRIGMAFADIQIIQALNKIKYPYNVNGVSQAYALKALTNFHKKDVFVAELKKQRYWLDNELQKLSFVKKIYPSQANFLLVKMQDAQSVFQYLLSQQIIVRDRSKLINCTNCLRITVGTQSENIQLIEALNKYEKSL